MYNEEIKMRFIKDRMTQSSISETDLKRIFEISGTMEEMNGKDLCNFSLHEIMELYKFMNVVAIDRLSNLNSSYLIYTNWCLHEHLVADGQNHFLELSVSDFKKLVNNTILFKRVIERETILEWVRKLPNPRDAFVILALFETGKSKDNTHIVNMKLSDIEGNTVHLKDRDVKVSNEFVNYAKNAYETDEYCSMSLNETMLKKLKNGECIYREYSNTLDEVSDFQKGRRIYNLVIRCFRYLGVDDWMTPNALVISGEIHMIKTRSAELGLTPMEFIYSPFLREVNNQYGNKKLPIWYLTRYGDYLK